MVVKTAVVGLGKVAQLKYLPVVRDEPGMRLTHVVDAAPTLLTEIGDRFGVPETGRLGDVSALPEGAADLILVLTHDHAAVAGAALDRAPVVFVEKPLCWTSAEAHDLADHARVGNTRLLTSQFRRHDPNVEALRRRMRELGRPLFVRAVNLAGNVKAWSGKDDGVVRPSAPEKAGLASQLADAWARVGDVRWRDHAQNLLQLGIHDLNVLDHVAGPVTAVTSATAGSQASISASLVLAGGVPASLHVAPLFGAPWMWRQSLEAVYSDRILRVEFGNPFQTVNLTRLVEVGPEPESRTIRRAGSEDPFVEQVRHVLDVVRTGATDTSVAAALRDLSVIDDVLAHVRDAAVAAA
jgi:predicted dehydrogenase